MNSPNAITELQRLAEHITEQDLRMMISYGGAAAVNEFIQTLIQWRINHLKNQHDSEASQWRINYLKKQQEATA